MADEVTRLRIGTVSAVDKAKLAARVIFKDENIVSGWLPVLQRTGKLLRLPLPASTTTMLTATAQ